MIECPICHVKNDGESRFCAECGQRLTGGSPGTSSGAQTAPPQAPTQEQRQQQRLHSPLLSQAGDTATGEPVPVRPDANADVNRLRQMNKGRTEQPQAAAFETPYKNPFDPRNAAPAEQQPASGQAPPETHRSKLRSPLLAGEEFDDEEWIDDPLPSAGKGGLRSPMLGAGGGGGRGLKSPLLGGGPGNAAQDDYQTYDQQAGSGSHLRSPLLGGAGAASYGSEERRRGGGQHDPSYQGQERRRGGLRSPILGGAGTADDNAYYGDDYDDEEPIDEDNPNVLRSPLLAARRPVVDRQKPPTGSNAENPQKAAQTADIMQIPNKPSPSSSYTSLRSIQGSGAAQPVAPEPPPAPATGAETAPAGNAYGAPAGYAPAGPTAYQTPLQPGQYASSNTPFDDRSGPGPGTASSGYPAGGQPPLTVPPAFQNMPTSPASVESTDAMLGQIFGNTGAPPDTGSGINVQPPSPRRDPIVPPARAESSPALEDEPPRPKPKSRMLAGAYEEDEVYTYQTPAVERFAAPQTPPSPIPKIIGVVVVLLFLGKSWVLMQVLGSDWKNYTFLVVDQIVGIILMLCIAALAFTQKN